MLRSFPLGDGIIQEVGAGQKSSKTLHPIQRRLFQKMAVEPKLAVHGFPVSPSGLLPPGTRLHAAHFVPGQLVDVRSRS